MNFLRCSCPPKYQAAGAVYRELVYIGIYGETRRLCFCLTLVAIFDFCIRAPEAREVFKNLPGAHGFVVVQYGPVASHGDPIRAQNDG